MLIEARAKMVRELDSETRWNASGRDAGVIVVGLSRGTFPILRAWQQ